MKKLKNIHPGEILLEEFLVPLKISKERLSKEIFVSKTLISRIISEKSRISARTALKFSKFFGNSPGFWLGLQIDFDLEDNMRKKGNEYAKIKKHRPSSLS
jgi:addiction module HigA family antidote